VACTFDPAVAPGTTLSCESNAVCHNGDVCVTDTATCLPLGPCVVLQGDTASFLADGTPCGGDDSNICVAGFCVESTCGDGVLAATVEECDDGNDQNDDECSNACTSARCGDGIVQTWESCDDGNEIDTDACLSTCQVARCGDGVARTDLSPGQTGHEECDDGNLNNIDGCVSDCLLPACGDGFTQAGEACDDGNDLNTDSCTNACEEAGCGDGFTQPPEACDDGNEEDADACTNTCLNATCGDGILRNDITDPQDTDYEACDDGNGANADGCLTTCQNNVCGDGELNPLDEECDDGNLVNGDGCSASCNKLAWVKTFAPGDLEAGRVAVGSPDLGKDYGTREVPAEPNQIGVMDQDNLLTVMDPKTGETLWDLQIDGVFEKPLMFLGSHYVFSTEDGRILGISDADHDLPTECDPALDPPTGASFCVTVPVEKKVAGMIAHLSGIPEGILATQSFKSLGAWVFMEDGSLWTLGIPGQIHVFEARSTLLEFKEFPGVSLLVPPEPEFRHRSAIQFSGDAMLVASRSDGVQALGQLCGQLEGEYPALQLKTEVPGELGPLTEEIAYLGNGGNAAQGDVAYVRAQDGLVYYVDLPPTDLTSDCDVAAPLSTHFLKPRQVSLIPIMIVPLSGHQIIWVDVEHRLRRGKMSQLGMNPVDDVILFELNPQMQSGLAFDPKGGAYDADAGIYLVDAFGVMRQVQVVTGTVEHTWQVPDWQVGLTALADSPMVFGRSLRGRRS
jgi:cysteine-rich repeat protein